MIGASGVLLALLLASGLGTAIGSILQKGAIWIPSVVLLGLSCAAAVYLILLIGHM